MWWEKGIDFIKDAIDPNASTVVTLEFKFDSIQIVILETHYSQQWIVISKSLRTNKNLSVLIKADQTEG